MNVLLLSNNAPNYHFFFNSLAKLLLNDGAHVVAAVDSTFSRDKNRLDEVGFTAVHDFSTHFSNHEFNPEIVAKFSDFPLNAALLSDFERAQIYDLWGADADIAFFDRLKSALLSFFEDLFDRYQIDLVLYEGVSNSFAHYALFVAQMKQKTYCGLAGSRLPGRFEIVADPLADKRVESTFLAIRNGEREVQPDARAWVQDYLQRIEAISPDYMKINGLDRLSIARRYFRRDRIKQVAKLLRHGRTDRTAYYLVGNPLRTHIRLFGRNAKRRLRSSRVRKLYQEPRSDEKFLLYPLHFHPEASTSILSGTYLDEYEVIRNIAFNLPEGVRLYVKDHVSAWAYPSVDFYRRIRKLPNVRLLAPEQPTKQLIKQSVGVITLTSTVGYEALLLGRQVFLYGSVFYQFHCGVTAIENPARLRDLLCDGVANPPSWSDQYTADFVAAYYLSTLEGTLNLMQSADEAERSAQEVYSKLRLIWPGQAARTFGDIGS